MRMGRHTRMRTGTHSGLHAHAQTHACAQAQRGMHAGTHGGMYTCTHRAKPVSSVGMGRIPVDQLPLMKASHHSLFSSCLSCLPLCPSIPKLPGFSFYVRYCFAHVTCCSSTFHAPSLISTGLRRLLPPAPSCTHSTPVPTAGLWGFSLEGPPALSKPKAGSVAPPG